MLVEFGDWATFVNKLFGKWCHMLKNDSDTTYTGQWVGFYLVGEEDPVFVLQCMKDFTPPCMHLQYLQLQHLQHASPGPMLHGVPTHVALTNGTNQLGKWIASFMR